MEVICIFPHCVPRIPDFVVFPFTRTLPFEKWWINSGWSDVIPLDSLPDKILICEEHFEPDLINKRHKVPKLALGALPTRNVQCPGVKSGPLKPAASDRVYCRLCGQQQACNLDEDLELLSNLDEIFQHQLQLSDFTTLPTGVCTRCKALGSTMQKFWKKCFDAQETLKAIFNNKASTSGPSKESCIAKQLTSAEHPSNVNVKKRDSTSVDREVSPDNCEEVVVVHTSQSDVIEEQFANEFEFESYGEELPHGDSTADECEENLKTEPCESENQLLSEHYANDYGDESSSREFFTRTVKQQERSGSGNEEESLHMCEICGNSYKTLNRLKAHINLHNSARNHECNICGHKFKTRRGLKEHVESKHERKSFPCQICGVQYSWKKGLERHMSTTHRGKAPKHICKVCNKAFPVPHKLKKHVMLHTGDRIYCEYCGKGYRFNYMLTQHKIRVHELVFEGVKLYKSKKMVDRQKATGIDGSSLSYGQESASC
ncbi:PR domain zinc finger protein 5-like [Anopheles maculipalpis]|uniref:PR domain zinc finger protein 5-like n=1 Tax=Anopheles maculipalpis TaxID=1496333 RepID=UPI0021590D35|nr:PR domain zinc finger protein 5-like [Anopheles maculipalpis]